jgi:hypothetical protein
MLAIQVNPVHQVLQVLWVILVHQVLRFQVKKEKRVFQVQSVFLVHKVLQVLMVNQAARHPQVCHLCQVHKVKKVIVD